MLAKALKLELADDPIPFWKRREGPGCRVWQIQRQRGKLEAADLDASNHFVLLPQILPEQIESTSSSNLFLGPLSGRDISCFLWGQMREGEKPEPADLGLTPPCHAGKRGSRRLIQ